ncbi:MAG: hypothetical protein LBR36_09125 [Bacteroidales bacterium]|jgi:hypothetical protein|nr:hypothetical protein [Bacteroidales bacterium]
MGDRFPMGDNNEQRLLDEGKTEQRIRETINSAYRGGIAENLGEQSQTERRWSKFAFQQELKRIAIENGLWIDDLTLYLQYKGHCIKSKTA